MEEAKAHNTPSSFLVFVKRELSKFTAEYRASKKSFLTLELEALQKLEALAGAAQPDTISKADVKEFIYTIVDCAPDMDSQTHAALKALNKQIMALASAKNGFFVQLDQKFPEETETAKRIRETTEARMRAEMAPQIAAAEHAKANAEAAQVEAEKLKLNAEEKEAAAKALANEAQKRADAEEKLRIQAQADKAAAIARAEEAEQKMQEVILFQQQLPPLILSLGEFDTAQAQKHLASLPPEVAALFAPLLKLISNGNAGPRAITAGESPESLSPPLGRTPARLIGELGLNRKGPEPLPSNIAELRTELPRGNSGRDFWKSTEVLSDAKLALAHCILGLQKTPLEDIQSLYSFILDNFNAPIREIVTAIKAKENFVELQEQMTSVETCVKYSDKLPYEESYIRGMLASVYSTGIRHNPILKIEKNILDPDGQKAQRYSAFNH